MAGTIKAEEAEHFGRLASEWWDPNGSSAMLHKLGPVRLSYIRERIDTHFNTDPQGFRPLAGKSALDVGCGAGLLCEPLARLGADVTGIDAAPENIEAARAHALQTGLAIDYRAGDFTTMDLGRFDFVSALEVIEHVAEPRAFLTGLAECLAPDGLAILSTPNRTLMSRVIMVEAAERLGRIPRGTHHWDQFITPDELEEMAEDCGLVVTDRRGIEFSPGKGLQIGDDLGLNYLMSMRHA